MTKGSAVATAGASINAIKEVHRTSAVLSISLTGNGTGCTWVLPVVCD